MTFTPSQTGPHRLRVSCVLHQTEPDSQTEALLASDNPNSQSAVSDIKMRRDIGWGGGREGGEGRVVEMVIVVVRGMKGRATADVSDSDVRMRSQTIDLRGG